INTLAYEYNPYEHDLGEYFSSYVTIANIVDLEYFLDVAAFYSAIEDMDEATLIAMSKIFNNTSNKYLRDSIESTITKKFGDQGVSVGEIYADTAGNIATNFVNEAIEKTVYNGFDDALSLGAFGFELLAQPSSISEALIYMSIGSSIQKDIQKYYWNHCNNSDDNEMLELRAMAIMYLKTAMIGYDYLAFDSGLKETLAVANETFTSSLENVFSYSEDEYAPDYNNDEIIEYLNTNYKSFLLDTEPVETPETPKEEPPQVGIPETPKEEPPKVETPETPKEEPPQVETPETNPKEETKEFSGSSSSLYIDNYGISPEAYGSLNGVTGDMPEFYSYVEYKNGETIVEYKEEQTSVWPGMESHNAPDTLECVNMDPFSDDFAIRTLWQDFYNYDNGGLSENEWLEKYKDYKIIKADISKFYTFDGQYSGATYYFRAGVFDKYTGACVEITNDINFVKYTLSIDDEKYDIRVISGGSDDNTMSINGQVTSSVVEKYAALLVPQNYDGAILYCSGSDRDLTAMEDGSNVSFYHEKNGYDKKTFFYYYVDEILDIDPVEGASEGLEFKEYGKYCGVSGLGQCTDTDIVVPSIYNGLVVRNINSDAFKDCTSLNSITFPDTVISINERAFQGCTSLTSVVMADSLNYIEEQAFEGCTSLKSITMSNSISQIGERAFANCSSITNIVFGQSAGIGQIEKEAFYSCTSLKEVIIPDSVTAIGEAAFVLCSGLEAVTFGTNSQLSKISDRVFASCENLNTINIPNGVTEIGQGAFFRCSSIIDMVIPDSVTIIGEGAFQECSQLLSVKLSNGIAKIENNLFVGCEKLNSIEIPNTVTIIGESSFSGCINLTQITIPNSVNTIASGAFSECSSLSQIIIPESVTSIGSYAFSYCSSLSEVVVPAGVTKLETYVFTNCTSLTNVTLGGTGFTEIEYGAFIGCTIFDTLIFRGTIDEFYSANFGRIWREQTTALTVVCSDGVVELD
ncbi:MAG: leucine-rich repeat protein, partial [Clostridia bacterium]|nr:leucine-rich repeat protein [Clostridia bacterium]